jgi:hypothetical protein
MGNYLMKYVNRNTFRSYNENELPPTPNLMYSEVYREKALIFTKRRSRSPNKSNKILPQLSFKMGSFKMGSFKVGSSKQV